MKSREYMTNRIKKHYKHFSIGDCTVVDLTDGRSLVITCDSIGAIGNKEADLVKVTPEHVGETTVRVALAEMIAIGATPVAISNGLSVETDPTGKRIVQGIREAMSELTESDIALTGSCEDNMKTVQTGAGITVIGLIDNDGFKTQLAKPGDIALLIGRTLVGHDYVTYFDKALKLTDYQQLRSLPEIKEMRPVGSKGIAYELDHLAENNGLIAQYDENIPIDIHTSGGPSSSCIVVTHKEHLETIQRSVNKEVTYLGLLQKK